jgi:hypothetical protein
MKLASLFASLAFGLISVGKCFPQQVAQNTERGAEAAVIRLYKQVVFRKPLGILRKKADRQAILPVLSRDLVERIRVAKECERDYFRQYADPNIKPAFDWLEFGLFSGGNEQALPSRVALLRSVKQKDGSYQVRVKLTYWGEFDKYPSRPSDPAHVWNWEVTAVVVRDGGHFAVNDVLYSKDTDETGLRLSQLLNHGCKDGKWVGYPESSDLFP